MFRFTRGVCPLFFERVSRTFPFSFFRMASFNSSVSGMFPEFSSHTKSFSFPPFSAALRRSRSASTISRSGMFSIFVRRIRWRFGWLLKK